MNPKPYHNLEHAYRSMLDQAELDIALDNVGIDRELFQELAHGPNGKSLGFAVVHFHRTDDAIRARNVYHGKIIDSSPSLVSHRRFMN